MIAHDPYTGQKIGNIYYITARGTGDGSKNNPANIDYALNNSKKNDILILLGDNGDIFKNSIELKESQKLLSPGGHLRVSSGTEGSRKLTFKPTGKKATLRGSNHLTDSGLVVLKNNNTISGLNLNNWSGHHAIHGFGIAGKTIITNNTLTTGNIDILTKPNNSFGHSDVLISDNLIKENHNEAIKVQTVMGIKSKVEITKNTINRSEKSGILVSANGQQTNYNYIINNNTIELSGENGIDVNNTSTEGKIDIRNNLIKESLGHGIKTTLFEADLENKTIIYNNKIQYAEKHGIIIENDNAKNNISIINNTINKALINGIRLDTQGSAAVNTTVIDKNLVESTSDHAIYVNTDNGAENATLIVNNTIKKILSNGIMIVNSLGSKDYTTIKNNFIEETSDNGIFIINTDEDTQSNIRIVDNWIRNAGPTGIEIMNAGYELESNLIIDNNIIESINSSGIYINVYDGSNIDASIINNIIKETNYDGIHIYIGLDPITFENLKTRILLDNNFFENIPNDSIYYEDPDIYETQNENQDPILFIYPEDN